jgi:arginine exporter protein ArgO
MYVLLAVLAAMFALLVAGLGAFAAWAAFGIGKDRARVLRAALSRWSVFDYMLTALFTVGTLFLLADLIGMAKARDQYPYFHYGYLLSGFVYNTLAGLFLFIRLGMTVRLLGRKPEESDRDLSASSLASADHDHSEPEQA